MTDVPARDGCAMAPHQRGATPAHELGQIAPHLHFLDQQRGVAEMVVGIPDRHLVADRCAHVEDRLDLLAGHSERNDAFAVVVHHRHHIRPRFVERAVDESFEIRRTPAGIDRRAVERELHDVVLLDAVGGA